MRFAFIPYVSQVVVSAPSSAMTSASGRAPSLLCRSARSFVLERDLELGAVGLDRAVGDDEILRHDPRHAEIAQVLPGQLDRVLGRLFPGFRARADNLDHLVDALRHVLLLPRSDPATPSGLGSPAWVSHMKPSYAERVALCRDQSDLWAFTFPPALRAMPSPSPTNEEC